MMATATKSARHMMTRSEVAERLGVSLRTVDLLPLRRYRVGQRAIRFDPDEVEQYLKDHSE